MVTIISSDKHFDLFKNWTYCEFCSLDFLIMTVCTIRDWKVDLQKILEKNNNYLLYRKVTASRYQNRLTFVFYIYDSCKNAASHFFLKKILVRKTLFHTSFKYNLPSGRMIWCLLLSDDLSMQNYSVYTLQE